MVVHASNRSIQRLRQECLSLLKKITDRHAHGAKWESWLTLVTEGRLLSQRTQLSTPMPFYNRSFPTRKGAPFDLLSISQALLFRRKEKPHSSVMPDLEGRGRSRNLTSLKPFHEESQVQGQPSLCRKSHAGLAIEGEANSNNNKNVHRDVSLPAFPSP